MFKLLIILVVVLFLMRGFFRLMYPQLPKNPVPKAIELKPCEYCGKLVPEDQGSVKGQYFFCSLEHQHQFFQ